MNTTEIKVAHISTALKWFHLGFMNKHSLTDYDPVENEYEPAIFVGVYNSEDVDAILRHKGFKLVMFCGSDIMNAYHIAQDNYIRGVLSDMHIYEYQIRSRLPQVRKYLTLPMKSFNQFKPVPLGDKIYYYGRTEKDIQHQHFKKDSLDILMKEFGEDRFIIGYQGHTMEYVQEEYYAKSFININLTKEIGFTTCLEMAHMGRLSVSNYPAAFCKPYISTEDIIRIIEQASKGLNPHLISELARTYYNETEDWKLVSYWK